MVVGPHDPLSTLMNTPLTYEGKAAIITTIWHTSRGFVRDPSTLATYFRYYDEQCGKFLHYCTEKRQPILTKTHRNIVMLTTRLQQSARYLPPLTKAQIMAEYRNTIPITALTVSDELVSDTVDFAARLLLMLDIRAEQSGGRVVNQDPVPWDDIDLPGLVQTQFSGIKQHSVAVRLEQVFTAPNIELIGDIQIVWTDNLADHLRMSDDDTTVSLYGHVQFLKLHQNLDLFPAEFIEETLRTLALLLPRRDLSVSRWFKHQQSLKALRKRIDSQATSERRLKAASRQISKFVYWHDRLVILKQAFDESQPKNLRQWWNDRRNPVQWYNFWFAVALIVGLTVFFGVVSAIEGGVQVYKAYHPSSS